MNTRRYAETFKTEAVKAGHGARPLGRRRARQAAFAVTSGG